MPETWYEVKPHLNYEIKPVEVVRSTASSVFVKLPNLRKESRSGKHTDFSHFWATYAEAVTYARGEILRKISAYQKNIDRWKDRLGELPITAIHHVDGDPRNNALDSTTCAS